jgi:integrase
VSNGKRRDNGDGSIWEESKGHWRGRIDINGKTYYRRGGERGEVKRKLEQLKRDAERGNSMVVEHWTVAKWLEHWLLTKRTKAPSTLQLWETNIRLHINPYVGSIPLKKLSAERLDHWLIALEDNGVGDRTRQLAVTILRMALQLAADRGKVPRNVAKTVERPSTVRKRREAPDSDRVRALLRAVEDDHRLQVFVLLTLGLGFRKGEALGLQWQDVNLETGEITVNRHVVHLNAAYGGLQHRKGAKTAAGDRESPIHELLSTALQRLSRQQKEEYVAGVWARTRALRTSARRYENPSAPPNDPRCWVLATRSGTMPSPDNITRDFKALCVRAGLGDRQTIHGLRHDYASLLAELGVPVRVAMELLGHSNELMTVYYQHVSRAAKREAVSKVGDWLQKVSG